MKNDNIDALLEAVVIERNEARKERDAAITLLYEVIVGMRNHPMLRATKLLADRGTQIPANVETFYMMREQRDELREAALRLGYLTGRVGHCGDRDVLTVRIYPEEANTWNKLIAKLSAAKGGEIK